MYLEKHYDSPSRRDNVAASLGGSADSIRQERWRPGSTKGCQADRSPGRLAPPALGPHMVERGFNNGFQTVLAIWNG